MIEKYKTSNFDQAIEWMISQRDYYKSRHDVFSSLAVSSGDSEHFDKAKVYYAAYQAVNISLSCFDSYDEEGALMSGIKPEDCIVPGSVGKSIG